MARHQPALYNSTLLRTLFVLLSILFTIGPVAAEIARPNILLIVADDLGYSDLGVFGSEIETPTLDALAKEGFLLTQFHAAPNCAPSRSAMLTGVDAHRAGLGGNAGTQADNQKGLLAYQGFLREDVVAVSELLRDAGYHTAMAGKWHMGHDARNLPGGRGFDQSFALLNGAASHWADQAPIIPGAKTTYAHNDTVVPELPADFYSSTYYTDRIIEYIDDGLKNDNPFFAYLAFTAPHNPLHAPDAYIAKYKGRYDKGWDVLASERLQRQKQLGLVDRAVTAAARPSWVLAWGGLTEKQKAHRARDMEIYAGMIDYVDHSVGRLLDHLRAKGVYENTLIVFLSDNGPSKTAIVDYLALGGDVAKFVRSFDNSLENKGRPGSSTDIGPGWAFAAATPLRLFKGYVAQGGIQVPAIIKMPGQQIAQSTTITTPIDIKDLAPTFLQAAGADYPVKYRGFQLAKLQGTSLLPLLESRDHEDLSARGLGWEAYGMDAWRQGKLKILRLPPPFGSGDWQLYDLHKDPGEITDIAAIYPELVSEMAANWETYATQNEVVHPDKPVLYAKPVSPGKY
jgi:arylsulfatase A-like enzyme